MSRSLAATSVVEAPATTEPVATFTGDSLSDTGIVRFQRADSLARTRFINEIGRTTGIDEVRT